MRNLYEVLSVVDEKDTVQMINLVLEYLSHESTATSFETRAILAARADSYALVTLRRTIDAVDGETSFFHLCPTTTRLFDLGIDEYFVFRWKRFVRDAFFHGRRWNRPVLAHDEDTIGDGYLGSSDSDTL